MIEYEMFHKYLDPKNDVAFKKIFGEEKNKAIPIDFINSVLNLEGQDRIADLEFINTLQSPEIAGRKESVVDALVRDERGCRYIIEMQVSKIRGFEKRAQYYAAKTYCAHFNNGETEQLRLSENALQIGQNRFFELANSYGVSSVLQNRFCLNLKNLLEKSSCSVSPNGQKYHELQKVVFLAITDYILFPEKDDYKSMHLTLDTETGENDLQDFSFTFVELPKFNRTENELKTVEEKWYYFLKTVSARDDIPQILREHPEIAQAYEILDRFNWTEEEMIYYDNVSKADKDAEGRLDAKYEEGRAIGSKNKAIEIAINLLKEGLEIAFAAKISGLNIQEVKELASEFAAPRT